MNLNSVVCPVENPLGRWFPQLFPASARLNEASVEVLFLVQLFVVLSTVFILNLLNTLRTFCFRVLETHFSFLLQQKLYLLFIQMPGFMSFCLLGQRLLRNQAKLIIRWMIQNLRSYSFSFSGRNERLFFKNLYLLLQAVLLEILQGRSLLSSVSRSSIWNFEFHYENSAGLSTAFCSSEPSIHTHIQLMFFLEHDSGLQCLFRKN